MNKTLIVGVGSILRADDGIGARVIDELEKSSLPKDVELHAGDISGLDLLKYFHGYRNIIIIDAADMKLEPGSIKVFNLSEIKKSNFNDKFSTHGMALLETLTLAEKLDLGYDIKIVGIQPLNTGFDLKLSSLIESRIPEIIGAIKKLFD
ncbi:MAG: hydrogenase maturation protease [Candidatus Omnitrophota bacterium]